jgi:deoxycytidine triphosphate deaminase
MILGREEILRRVKEGHIIENFEEGCLESSGYDLRVGRFYATSGSAFMSKAERKMPDISEIYENILRLGPGEYVLIETMEKVNMPPDLAARVLNKSSLFRCGASTFNALVDPGFSGTLTFGLKNISDHDFSIEKGAKVAQIVFEEVRGEVKLYDGNYQGGKVV